MDELEKSEMENEMWKNLGAMINADSTIHADWLLGSAVRHLLVEVEDLREEIATLRAKVKELTREQDNRRVNRQQ